MSNLGDLRTASSALGFGFKNFGEFFNFLGFLDHAHREHVGGGGLLDFFA